MFARQTSIARHDVVERGVASCVIVNPWLWKGWRHRVGRRHRM